MDKSLHGSPAQKMHPQRDPHYSNTDTIQESALAALAISARAAQLLPRLNKEDIPAMVRYIRATSKHPLAQTEFVERYLETTGRIIAGARALLESGHSSKGLEQFRNVLVKDLPPFAAPAVPPRAEWSGIQERYERDMQALLSGLASAPADHKELRLRELNLAIIALKVQTRREEFDQLMKGEGRARLVKYKDLMDKAYKSAAQRHGENFSIEDRLAAFVELALDRTGKCPKLRIFNDFDGNLTQVPESGSPWKPGEPTNQLLNTLDKAARFPMFVRLVTTELPGLDTSMRQAAATLYGIAAHESNLYEDVQDLFFNTVSVPGVQHNILTANHAGLVAAKLEAIGRAHDVNLLAVGQLDWYENKVDRLLLEIMKDDDVSVYFFADDNDGPVAAHFEVTEPVLPKGRGVKEAVYFHDLLFLASRHSIAHATRVGDVMVRKKIDHVDLCREPTATGFKGFGRMRTFIDRYQRTVAEETPVRLTIRYPTYYASGDSHISGDVVRRCRVQERYLQAENVLPTPDVRTIIKPLQDTTLVGSHQFDLGSTTAIYDSDNNCWIVLYKAASEPSGSRPMAEPSPSNVFAARFYVSEGRVEYFDHHRSSESQVWMEPFLTSALPAKFSRDGLHDPRATTIAGGPTYILACAFNKQEEQASIKEAAGDLSKPIRGAVTELFVTNDPKDPQSYSSLGIFGPDFHFKNMVLFPERIEVNGQPSLVALCRKMPGIQAIPIPDEAFTPGAWSEMRTKFWNDVLTPDSIAKYHVLAPEYAHEGRFNPNAPGRLGQVAPGLTPIKVQDRRPGGKGKHYWLMVYNSVPDFKADASGSAKGRVIGAALLDYKNPWTLVARSPVPLITGRHELDVLEADGVVSRHPDVAFCGGGGVDPQGRLSIFYTEDDSIIRCATYASVDDVVEYLLQFDSRGQRKG
jgi:predicted GH43/DUF377 family glycosyl hydrolase